VLPVRLQKSEVRGQRPEIEVRVSKKNSPMYGLLVKAISLTHLLLNRLASRYSLESLNQQLY